MERAWEPGDWVIERRKGDGQDMPLEERRRERRLGYGPGVGRV